MRGARLRTAGRVLAGCILLLISPGATAGAGGAGVTPGPAAPPAVAPWEAIAAGRAVVYAVPGVSSPTVVLALAERLDAMLRSVEADLGLRLDGRLIYPLYPSADDFRREWWRFAALRDGWVHGWGTVVGPGPVHVVPSQVTHAVARYAVGPAVPLLGWGLGDLLADRLLGIDSHAHARIFLDRAGLPPIREIIHQVDFSRALPGAHAQSVSFLAFLAEVHGLPAVVAFARYRQAVEFGYAYTLARSPGGLVTRPGGAEAYVEAWRASEAARRLDLDAAAQATQAGRRAAEAAQRQVRRARLLLQAALWAMALGPIILAVILLVGPIRRGRRRR